MPGDLVATAVLLGYYLVFAIVVPTLLKMAGVGTELVRKLQHIAYSLSVFILLRMFSTWYAAVAAAAVLAVVAYPVLLRVENSPAYARLLVDRLPGSGELRRQLVYVQVTFAILIFVFCGLLDTAFRYVVAAAVMAWGFGDAAAALFGRAFGRKRVVHRLIEGTKTYVGTAAMAAFGALGIFVTLVTYGGKSWGASLLIAVLVAPVCAVVELFSRRGVDTVTVPLAGAALILSLGQLLALLGL